MTEQEIIQRILAGQTDLYEQLVERYHKGLIYHIYHLCWDNDIADDLAQEAFIRAYQKLADYNSRYAFSTWLYRIATNLTYDHLRKKQSLPLDEDTLPALESSPISEQFDAAQRAIAVRTAIAGLPVHYQSVITMFYWERKSYEEIAQIMDRPVGTVRTWLSRAKHSLKEALYEKV
jgi:RNA polymerase sigma factor (sigma-70 family)